MVVRYNIKIKQINYIKLIFLLIKQFKYSKVILISTFSSYDCLNIIQITKNVQ